MRVPALLRRALLATACALALGLPRPLPAAEELGVFVDFATADASLNETYQRVLAALPSASRESLRRAQRTWVGFIDKDVKAISSLSTLDERWELRLAETVARRNQLEAMLQPPSQSEAAGQQDELRRADRDLNNVYRSVLARHPDDAEAIRAAQRAWVTFRDENARACRGAEVAANLSSTTQRVAQLRKFYTRETEPPEDSTEEPQQFSDSREALPAGRKIPNPYDRAKE